MIFRGSEALSANQVTRYELRADFKRVLPDIYAPKREPLTLADRTNAAFLWSHGTGVVTGAAASALHGAKWVSNSADVELNHPNARTPSGIATRAETLLDSEITQVGGVLVTTVARTAFDLARRGPVIPAVQRLDALAHATGFKVDDVLTVAAHHRGVRGSRRVPEILDLVDPGGHSPQETYWRLQFIATGYQRPDTQVPIFGPGGRAIFFLDMGWPQLMIAAEYDGEQHRFDDDQYGSDIKRSEYVAAQRWHRVRIIAGDRKTDVFRRVEAFGLQRTCEPPAILRPRRR